MNLTKLAVLICSDLEADPPQMVAFLREILEQSCVPGGTLKEKIEAVEI